MAKNFPGPYQLSVYYTTWPADFPHMGHVCNINVDVEGDPDPGTAWDEIMLVNNEGGNVSLDEWTTLLLTELKTQFPAAQSSFDYCELYKVTPGTYIRTWVSAITVGEAGTSESSGSVSSQGIFTFRTKEGGITRLTLMEHVYPADAKVSYENLDTDTKSLVDFLMGVDTAPQVMLGIDTSPVIALLSYCPGNSEALFKARYRY